MMNYIKGNLLTLLVGLSILILTYLAIHANILEPSILMLLISSTWLAIFMLDALFLIAKREYIDNELNVLVRNSKDTSSLIKNIIKVLILESIILVSLSMLLGALGLSFMESTMLILALFASIHLMAYIRSYLFVKQGR